MKKLFIIIVYILFAGIAYGQTFQKGSIIGIHEWTITPDSGITMSQFFEFQKNEYLPLFEKHMKGIKTYIIQSNENEQSDKIGVLWCWESAEAKERYFSEEARKNKEISEIIDIIMSKRSELEKLGSWSVNATNWVIQ